MNHNHRNVKKFSKLEEELKALKKIKGGFPLIVDTGALIDLQRECDSRRGLFAKDICEYLETIEKYANPLVTKRTFEEIEYHTSLKRNRNNYDLSPCVLGRTKFYKKALEEYESTLVVEDRSFMEYMGWLHINGDIFYKLGGKRKDTFTGEDGVSETDLEILKKSHFYATCPKIIGKEVPRVIGVLTSDGGHVGQGVIELQKLFPNLNLIDTRE